MSKKDENPMKAFIELQKSIKSLNTKTDASVNFGKTKFDYLSLPKLLEQIREACNKHNIYLNQSYSVKDGVEVLITSLIHESGKSLESQVIIDQGWKDVKDWGGLTTYKRRYALMAILGFHQGDDKEEERTFEKLNNISQQQINNILSLTSKKPEIRQALIKKYGSLADIPQNYFNTIISLIEKGQ